MRTYKSGFGPPNWGVKLRVLGDMKRGMRKRIAVTVAVALCTLAIATTVHAERITTGRPPKLVVIPDDGFKPIVKLLSHAAGAIDLVMYRMDDPAAISALKTAAARGVKVRVMLEKDPDEGAAANRSTEEALKKAGVFTSWSNPEFKQTMERAASIDRKLGLVSTFDLIGQDEKGCRGFAVTLQDPRDVSDLAWMFDADWSRVRAKPLASSLAWNPGGARTRILNIIRRAKRSIDVYADDIKDGEAMDTLKEAAGRGVRVRIIAGPKGKRQRSSLTKMRMAGAQVKHLKGMTLCARAIIADSGGESLAIVGAARLAEPKRDRMRALGVVVSDDERLGALKRTFERDWRASVR